MAKGWLFVVSLVALPAAICPVPMRAASADQAPDLAAYDCTRTDTDARVPGDQLAAQGFRIASQARFGAVNLMLADPKSAARANCFKRAQ